MGDRANDPVDHARTTRQHAGETMKNTRNLPGIIVGLVGLTAFIICLFLFATGREPGGVIAAVVAVLAAGAGFWVLVAEHRRVRDVEERWSGEHGGAPLQPPSS